MGYTGYTTRNRKIRPGISSLSKDIKNAVMFVSHHGGLVCNQPQWWGINPTIKKKVEKYYKLISISKTWL